MRTLPLLLLLLLLLRLALCGIRPNARRRGSPGRGSVDPRAPLAAGCRGDLAARLGFSRFRWEWACRHAAVRSEFDRAAVPSRELGLIAAPVVVSGVGGLCRVLVIWTSGVLILYGSEEISRFGSAGFGGFGSGN